MPRTTLAVPVLSLALLAAACSGDGGTGLATGSIKVVVNPATSPFDGNGFAAQVDQAAPRHVPDDGIVTFDALNPGDHTITLSSIDPPCSTVNNPRSVTVTAGDITTITFNINCVSTGFIAITTHTTGTNPDPNGYAVEVDGNDAPIIEPNGTLTVAVDAGGHVVQLTDIAANCAVQDGEPSQNVTVTAGETAQANFVIACN